MLVLLRRRRESIRIGSNITVTVLDVLPNGDVRLGFEAPKDVLILRQELCDNRVEDRGDDDFIARVD